MVRWVVGSISYSGPIELFLVQASAPQHVYITHCPIQTAQAAEVCAQDSVHEPYVDTRTKISINNKFN